MTRCLDDQQLFEALTETGATADRLHVKSCRDCAARAALLRSDLEQIGSVLGAPPLHRPQRWQRPAWSNWLPLAAGLAAAAAALIAVLAWPHPTTRVASSDTDITEFTRDVAHALFAANTTAGWNHRVPDSAYLDAALYGGWPCQGNTWQQAACSDWAAAYADSNLDQEDLK